jgi:GT2 family glycosyltransferase
MEIPVGFVLTVYGDEPEMTEKALDSFLETQDYPSQLLVVLTNPSDRCRKLVEGYANIDVWQSPPDLPLTKALNHGIKYFTFSSKHPYENVGWLHNDMDYCRPWVKALVEKLESEKDIGKISPINIRDGDLGTPNAEEREGNECPWIIPLRIFMELGCFDEDFIRGGEKEDWDMNKRIKNAGYRVLISPVSQVMHVAMATRFKHGTTSKDIQIHNHDVYFRKWGTHDAPC